MHLQPVDIPDMEGFVTAIGVERRASNTADTSGTFDDVFGSEPSSPTLQPLDHSSRGAHPSDIPRLQAEHATAGYREGVTAAKAQSIQAGFDEGFSLGGAIGSLAGQILGTLEGIAGALVGQDDAVSKNAASLLADAKTELKTEKIFGPEFWNQDGTWKYAVENGSGGVDIIFADVANAHPLIQKWTKLVDAEVARWGINRDIMGLVDEEVQQPAAEHQATSSTPQPRQPLAW